MWARRRRRVSSAAERWLWLRWGRGCSRASARPSRDPAERQPRYSGETAHSLRRSPSSRLALSPKTLPRHFPLEGPPASKAPLAPFTSQTPRRHRSPPCTFPLGGIRVEDTSSPSAGEAILESCRAHESEEPPEGFASGPVPDMSTTRRSYLLQEPPEGLANVRFAQTLSKAAPSPNHKRMR